MKKLISVILVVTSLFALASCSALSKIPLIGGLFKTDFEDAIKNTNPEKMYIETSVTDEELGSLTSKYDIIYKEDGSAVITYSYEKFNDITADEFKSVFKGTITRSADGKFSGDLLADVDVSAMTGGVALNLSAIGKDAKEINEAGDVLTATVAAKDTKAVFGKAFPHDVTLEITLQNEVVTYIMITYDGGSIICQYK